MRKVLTFDFFARPTAVVAKELLGKFLVRRLGKKRIILMISETEAYDGFKDRGSHASRGKTRRNWPMFGPPGRWYVYFTYGMHWMLNIVTREKDYPAAVLIRSGLLFTASRKLGNLKSLKNKQRVGGPGRLTKVLKIDGKLSGQSARRGSGLWIEDWGIKIPAAKIKKGPRIGIEYAGAYWAKRHLRFYLE
jgi:DNA-3-methyladenine glycosylase